MGDLISLVSDDCRDWGEFLSFRKAGAADNTDAIVLSSVFLYSDRLPHHLTSVRNRMAMVGNGEKVGFRRN